MNSPMSEAEASDFYADPVNQGVAPGPAVRPPRPKDRKSTRLNSSH